MIFHTMATAVKDSNGQDFMALLCVNCYILMRMGENQIVYCPHCLMSSDEKRIPKFELCCTECEETEFVVGIYNKDGQRFFSIYCLKCCLTPYMQNTRLVLRRLDN